MSRSYNNKIEYKACTPEATIDTLRTSLNRMNIFAFENQWWTEENNSLFSVQILLDNIHRVRTAGKGINRKYALASGLAELLERLQNLQYTRDIRSCHSKKEWHYTDAVIRTYEELESIKHFFDKNQSYLDLLSKEKEIVTVPFYNVFENTLTYFPINLFWWTVGSNGMCAGNTPQEALIQGICEIFERYVQYKMYFEKQNFPTIPLESLKLLPQQEYIDFFQENGISVEIKDCSLNGTLPVVGVLVSIDNKANFAIGVAPDFGIALERCFTEFMQGQDINSFIKGMPLRKTMTEKELKIQYLLALRAHGGSVPENVFEKTGAADEANLFWTSSLTSEETLNDLINKIKGMGFSLFVRDVSFLGFPSYHIYIPGMSEVIKNTSSKIELIAHTANVKEIFFNLSKVDKENMAILAEVLHKNIYHGKDNNLKINLLNIFDLPYREDADLNRISPNIFLIALYCQMREYRKALDELNAYLKATTIECRKTIQALECFREIIMLCIGGKSLSQINDILKDKYPKNILEENYILLDNNHTMDEIFGIPKPENCSSCNLCYAKELEDLAIKLEKAMKRHDFCQLKLKKLFYTSKSSFQMSSAILLLN